MANRLKKLMAPLLKEECNKAFQRGFEEGKQAGWDKRVLSYENEIECLKIVIKGLEERATPRFLYQDGKITPLDRVWIPVGEMLPEIGARVLVYCESKTIRKHVTACTYMGGHFGSKQWSRHVRKVTHWMPLPEPPKL